MLNYRRLLPALACIVLSLGATGTILSHSIERHSDTIIASRYHQRQHSMTATSRFGFRSNHMNSTYHHHHHHQYRQQIDRPNSNGPHYLRPQEKVATRPANGVQS